MPSLPPLPDAIRTLTDEEADRLDSHEPPIHTPKNCRICGGSKTYRWWADDKREEIIDWDCNCVDQWILYRYLRHAGVGFHYMTLGWADMNYAQAPVIKEVQDYITYDGFIRTGIGLYLYGDMGTGKTTLASLAARKFLADGHDVYMTSFTSLLDAFTSTWRDNEERKWFYRRVKNSRILFIDDLGREGSQRTTTTTAMDDVLRHRVSSGLVTCMTSNLAPGEISGRYGTNVFDLLTECSSPVEFKWTAQEESKRLAVKARRNFEIKNKLVRPLVLG